MLLIDRSKKRFERLRQPDLQGLSLSERYHLQAMICRSPEAFFSELGESLLLLGEEIRPAEWVDDRIDLLALDPSGAVVVIELKRGSHKLQLLQALSYAGMIAKWEPERLLSCRQTLQQVPLEAVEEEVENFLLEDAAKINEAQRIILIAEDFEFEVLVTAEWLNERYGVDIRCYRLQISADAANEFLSCSCIYPPAELQQHANRRGRGGTKPAKWADWEEALREVNNPAVAAFFRSELASGRENYLRKRALRFKLDGRRRWVVSARRDRAYVWQNGRFSGDEAFWAERLGSEASIQPVREGRSIRFRLTGQEQFDGFRKVISGEITNAHFTGNGNLQEDPAEP